MQAAAPSSAIQDTDAEQWLIGSLLLDPDHIEEVTRIASPSGLTNPILRAAFEAIVERKSSGTGVDVALVLAELRDLPDQAEVKATLARCAAVPTAAHAVSYAKQVAERATKRRLADLGGHLQRDALNGKSSAEILADLHATTEDELRRLDPTGDGRRFKTLTCRDLAGGDYSVEWLIDGLIAAGQPMIVAGPQKCLKTNTLVDLAVSLATGKPLLGRFELLGPRRVLMMSAESGLATLQETARRVAISKQLHLEEVDGLLWCDDVPQFGDAVDGLELGRLLADESIDAVIIDPAYMCMPGADAANLMIQGGLLRQIAAVCSAANATLILAHHTKRATGAPSNDPLTLADIAWAGFPEFARQWWLLNRRERYEEGTGEHRLWLSVGGSAGHSALWAVDVAEGAYSPFTDRQWDVTVRSGSEVRRDAAETREAEAEQKREEKAKQMLQADMESIVTAMQQIGAPETQSKIATAAGISGQRAGAAIRELAARGDVVGGAVERSNSQQYPGFELVQK
ncbi:MAG: AAA family ATPase [Planctomycetota bacterium]